MKKCPNLNCNHDLVLEYSLGNCPECRLPVVTCPNCGEYNREFARYCRICGKSIDYNKMNQMFYTRKLQKTASFSLNKFTSKKLDFIDSIGLQEMPFLFLAGNRVIITTPNGFLYDWDFVFNKEINRKKIPNAAILVKPLLCNNLFYFASGNTVYSYSLLGGEIKDTKLKNESLSIVSLVEWQDLLYGLFIDKDKRIHLFGKIDHIKKDLDEVVEIKDDCFSSNILQMPDSIYLFSVGAVYGYTKENEKANIKTLKDFPKKDLNISGKLYVNADMNTLYIPVKNEIVQLNLNSGQASHFTGDLGGTYYTEFTRKRLIVSDDSGLTIFNFSEKKMAESQTDIFLKNFNFNFQSHSMNVVSDRLLFSYALRSQGDGGFLIPWMLDEPRMILPVTLLANSKIPGRLNSNIDIHRNFIGFITSDSEALIWQF